MQWCKSKSNQVKHTCDNSSKVYSWPPKIAFIRLHCKILESTRSNSYKSCVSITLSCLYLPQMSRKKQNNCDIKNKNTVIVLSMTITR